MYPKASDDTAPDPDICPVCHQHYEDGCEEDCDCDQCQNRAEAAYQSRVDDGESFRGGEASAYVRDQQIAMRRVK